MKKHHLELTAIESHKVTRIYRGIELEKYNKNLFNKKNIKKKYGIAENAEVIGCVGRLTPIKNQELLIRAAPEVLPHFPDMIFMFVGGEETDKIGKGYKDYLQNLSGDLGVWDKVFFTGFVENIPEITSTFDVSVLTTLKESFGNVFIEAMGLEIPVIGSRAGGVPEIIREDYNGKMYESGNHKDLARCIRNILKNPEIKITMGKHGRKLVEKEFDLKKNVNKYEELFFRLLE